MCVCVHVCACVCACVWVWVCVKERDVSDCVCVIFKCYVGILYTCMHTHIYKVQFVEADISKWAP